MELTREEMRNKIEEALRALAPGPYERVDGEDVFLTLAGPDGAEVEYVCGDSLVHLNFGPGGSDVSEYNTVDEDGSDDFAEEDLKDILKGIIRSTQDIVSERVFAASYKKFFVPVGGLYPAAEFESLRKKKGFSSQSWNGRFTWNFPGP